MESECSQDNTQKTTMPGEMVVAPVQNDRPDYDGDDDVEFTTMLVKISGGLMLGYDVGISGGITSMTSFLKKFFPDMVSTTEGAGTNCMTGFWTNFLFPNFPQSVASTNNYCNYNNHKLQSFTSSLYIAGLVASFVAPFTSRKYGHRLTIRIAAYFFVCGTILCASAQSLAILIFGRIYLGIGVGFANQALPLYLSEMAFTSIRRDLNFDLQTVVAYGILLANFVNYGANRIDGWGWRLALGLAGVPAVLLAIGGLLLLDTPKSLIERGKLEEGRRVLQKARWRVKNVDKEFKDLVAATSRIAKHNPFKNIIRRNRPQLVITMFLQLFRHFSGITAIMFYSPLILQTLGFDSSSAFALACYIGSMNVEATVFAKYIGNKVGQRKLLLICGSVMFCTQLAAAAILGLQLTTNVVVMFIYVFVFAFGCSWGPLGWLITREMFPPETHPAGQSVTVSTNLLLTFLIVQSFPSMLCSMEYGIFLFFTGFIVIMTLFANFFLPQKRYSYWRNATKRHSD